MPRPGLGFLHRSRRGLGVVFILRGVEMGGDFNGEFFHVVLFFFSSFFWRNTPNTYFWCHSPITARPNGSLRWCEVRVFFCAGARKMGFVRANPHRLPQTAHTRIELVGGGLGAGQGQGQACQDTQWTHHHVLLLFRVLAVLQCL